MDYVYILFWLFVKHFICDFPLQAFPYQYKNKGTYGHLGGVLHSATHGIGTFVVMVAFVSNPILWYTIAMLDMCLHYHIDWAKMNINKSLGLRPDNSELYWILLGVDQLLHALTYFIIVWVIHNG